MILSTIAQGNVDAADICFLVAFILFFVLAVIAFTRQATESVMSNVGFALVALGLLLL